MAKVIMVSKNFGYYDEAGTLVVLTREARDVPQDVPNDLARRMLETGAAKLPTVTQTVEVTEGFEVEPEDDTTGDDGGDLPDPSEYHEGGGWYSLPNGEKVQGKEEAARQLAVLQGQ